MRVCVCVCVCVCVVGWGAVVKCIMCMLAPLTIAVCLNAPPLLAHCSGQRNISPHSESMRVAQAAYIYCIHNKHLHVGEQAPMMMHKAFQYLIYIA
jgi:hypothetical protein